MSKSLGDKRNELSEEHIQEITRLYGEFGHDAVSKFLCKNKPDKKIASKIFDNREFGFLKMTVERPLRLNFRFSEKRINKLYDEKAFISMAISLKRKSTKEIEKEEAAGRKLQNLLIEFLKKQISDKLIMDRTIFRAKLKKAFKANGLEFGSDIVATIEHALSEKDPKAEICRDKKGNPEPDSDLRDTELVPLPEDIPLPLPLDYDKKAKNDKLLELVKDHCEEYLKKEVLPHVNDAWIDHKKTKVGYEIPLNRHFYVYEPPRPLNEIETDIEKVEKEILGMLKSLKIA